MNQLRNAQITATLGQALRDKIGEQRFNTWFTTTGARLEARDDAVVVRADEVYLHFLRNSFKSDIAEVAQTVLGEPRAVLFESSAASSNDVPPAPRGSGSPRPAIQQPTLLPFPPQNDARRLSPLQVAQTVRGVLEPSQEQPVQPPKRKRGRPRKNSSPVLDAPQASALYAPAQSVGGYSAPELQASAFPFYGAPGFQPASNPATPTPATFLPDALVAADAPTSDAALQPSAEIAPPKRKRGRPRKNPAPTTSDVPETPAVNVSFPFADAYNRSLLDVQAYDANGSAAQSAPSPTVDFTNDERAAASLGSFDDARNLVAPQEAPRRRGRPKGSVNRANRADAEGDVQRDANGYVVARTPAVKPQVRSVGGESRKFASLKTFAVGPSNATAVKMLELVVLQPGIMSPLYLYGSTSVGKTRLLEGVCDAYLRNPAAAKKPPLYMTADQFTTQFTSYIVASGAQSSQKFRDRFRNISLFALDDVQFLEGKKATQIELVKTLDWLRALGVQVVVSGNRPLVDMTFLREELMTRMQSGLNVEIAPPERETLAVVLRQIAAERNLVVPEDVCRYVVSRFATHAREVIGAVNRLYAMHLTTGAPVTLDFAREALAGLAPVSYRNIRLEDVERVVQETFALEPNALKSSSRARKNADPRALAMWLARKHTRAALAEIGAFFGGRRHSAVLSAQKKVDGWLNENAALANGDAPEKPVADLLKALERELTASVR